MSHHRPAAMVPPPPGGVRDAEVSDSDRVWGGKGRPPQTRESVRRSSPCTIDDRATGKAAITFECRRRRRELPPVSEPRAPGAPASPRDLVAQLLAGDDGDLLAHPLVGVEVVPQAGVVLLDDHPGRLLHRLRPDASLGGRGAGETAVRPRRTPPATRARLPSARGPSATRLAPAPAPSPASALRPAPRSRSAPRAGRPRRRMAADGGGARSRYPPCRRRPRKKGKGCREARGAAGSPRRPQRPPVARRAPTATGEGRIPDRVQGGGEPRGLGSGHSPGSQRGGRRCPGRRTRPGAPGAGSSSGGSRRVMLLPGPGRSGPSAAKEAVLGVQAPATSGYAGRGHRALRSPTSGGPAPQQHCSAQGNWRVQGMEGGRRANPAPGAPRSPSALHYLIAPNLHHPLHLIN